ncbi:MAG: TetR/AcrR family transcriptional regulator [Oscillochloris sp.]|nr:TetR/AcrR family transcriptional regulator [Oscillochloris sp.]
MIKPIRCGGVMPKPTFENLAPAKRRAIIEIAVEEFAEHPYALASISRIVERAGIAKGSLYQYFAHKQDLFLYLVEYAAAAQLAILQELSLPEPESGFFALLRRQMGISNQVAAAAPHLARLIARAYSDDLPFHDQVLQRLQQAGEDHLEGLIRRGIAAGELDPDLDPELAALMIKSLTGEIGQLITRRLGISAAEAAADPSRLSGPEAERIYDQVIAVLQRGMQNP